MIEAGSPHEKKLLLRLLRHVARGADEAAGQGIAAHVGGKTGNGAARSVPAGVVDRAVALGLVERNGEGVRLLPDARAFLRRAAAEREEAFLAQHADIVPAVAEVGGERHQVRLNRSESPLGPLSRLRDRDGAPFLPDEAVAAGDRLAADFTRAQLQPRVTASWEPRLAGRGKGERGGMAELTESAVAARIAVNRAIDAMGPELSGVALDVCCFMKGLETVERERQWPVRSAKLMLRTALLALSRHYAPPRRDARMQHWGTEDFRPGLS